jgi:hypothetical protein
MLVALAKHLPLTVLPRRGAADSDLCDVALALTDCVIAADEDTVSGLERRVVVGMKGGLDRLLAMSRSMALVIWIDEPDTV